MSIDQYTQEIATRVGTDSGLNASFKFDLGDDGIIHIDGKSVPNSVSNEDKPADVTMKMSLETFGRIYAKEIAPPVALMQGKIKVEGDMMVAMKLGDVLG